MTAIKKLKQLLYLSTAVAFLFTTGFATARGRDDSPWTITAPAAARPGETVPVIINTSRPIPEATASLRTIEGKTVSQVATFSLGGDKKQGFRSAALIPLCSLQEPGLYRITVLDPSYEDSLPFTIEERTFFSETIPLNSTNTSIKTDISELRMEQIRKLSSILNTQSKDATIFPGPYSLPVRETRRTSGFGDRRTFKYSTGKSERTLHYGIDFGIPTGTPVFSTGDGLVVLAESRITTGWTVVIEHLPGVYSLYYHMDSLSTAEGELVRRGTLIGKSGCTGLSTGPHLHWEFRVNGIAVDPDWFVERILF
ncbi:MAG TPA: M23 family metallopeptidase [Treponema sp.]|nr:M23 family metallopeptidase [Treponema sp.]